MSGIDTAQCKPRLYSTKLGFDKPCTVLAMLGFGSLHVHILAIDVCLSLIGYVLTLCIMFPSSANLP